MEVQRLVKSQTALKADVREFFTEKQLAFIEPYLTRFQPDEEEEQWIEKSRQEVEMKKEKELMRQREEIAAAREREQEAKKQAQIAERLREEAEAGHRRARYFLYIVGGVAAIAIFAVIVAAFQWKVARARRLEVEDSLRKFEEEETKRARLEIGSLSERADTLSSNGFYLSASILYKQADSLALSAFDGMLRQEKHDELSEKLQKCQRQLSNQ